jgi:Flp pilus assembly protein TadB
MGNQNRKATNQMQMGGSNTAEPSCARCSREAVQRCSRCEDLLCGEHITQSRGLAQNVFGPYLFARDAVVCGECSRERFWLAVRAATAVVAVLVVALAAIESSLIAALIGLGGLAVWFIAAGRLARRASEQRISARKTTGDAAQSGP